MRIEGIPRAQQGQLQWQGQIVIIRPQGGIPICILFGRGYVATKADSDHHSKRETPQTVQNLQIRSSSSAAESASHQTLPIYC